MDFHPLIHGERGRSRARSLGRDSPDTNRFPGVPPHGDGPGARATRHADLRSYLHPCEPIQIWFMHPGVPPCQRRSSGRVAADLPRLPRSRPRPGNLIGRGAGRLTGVPILEFLEHRPAVRRGLDGPRRIPAAGSTALIGGGGFQPGDAITLQVTHTDGNPDVSPANDPWTVTADTSGDIQSSWYVNPASSAGDSLETGTARTRRPGTWRPPTSRTRSRLSMPASPQVRAVRLRVPPSLSMSSVLHSPAPRR